jgi:transcriptional regulator with XRE-family HTH domain
MTANGTSTPYSGHSSADVRRRELADFLRSRRERITPDQVGLPAGRRRRTPGLRREEVAQLSAVGVTWYTWLEQARDIQVSAQVLDAIARALMLDPPERAHLFVLAGVPDPDPGRECPYVTPALLATLE